MPEAVAVMGTENMRMEDHWGRWVHPLRFQIGKPRPMDNKGVYPRSPQRPFPLFPNFQARTLSLRIIQAFPCSFSFNK